MINITYPNKTMKKLANTVSLCEHCYRHVPAERFERDGKIWLGKTCSHHPYEESLIEPDAEFYHSQLYTRRLPSSYWLEITNRCNLECDHCYQMPENKSVDPSIDFLLLQVRSLPNDGNAISLVGAEPTTRKDLINIVNGIRALPMKHRSIMIVSNGINLGNSSYASKFKDIPNLYWTFGLNHPSYNGLSIRKKQMQGIRNCQSLGLKIKNFTYTLSNLTQLDYVLTEMQQFAAEGVCDNVRIQLGVDIGRTPDDHGKEEWLSDLVRETKNICNEKGWSYNVSDTDGNRITYMMTINGVIHRLIKWCSVKTIDLEEVQSEAWANIVPNKPMSTLLHQVIIRDRLVNDKMLLFDTIPKKYQKTDE